MHLIEQVGFSRYRLHDLVRSFAAEQGDPAGDDAALGRLMAFHVQAVVHATAIATARNDVTPQQPEQPEPDVPLPALPDPSAAMGWLDSELPNIVAIVQHAAGHGPHEPAWEISRNVGNYCWIRRSLPEWRAINEAALAAAHTAQQPEAVARALNALAMTIWASNDLTRAQRLFEEALALNARLGREGGQAANHTNLGGLCRQTGQLATALAHTKTAIHLGRRLGRPLTVANALLNLGGLHRDLGALYESSKTIRRALAAYRTLGSTDGELTSRYLLASVQCELGHYRAAEATAQQGMQLADAFGSVHGRIFARDALTDVLIATGRARQGRELSEAALKNAAEHGERRLIIPITLRLAAALAATHRHDQAREEAGRARHLAIEQHDVHGCIEALLILAQLPDEPAHAQSLARAAEREAARAGLVLWEAKAQQARAELLLAGRDPAGAQAAAAQAWPALRRSGAKPWIMRCLTVLRAASVPGPAAMSPAAASPAASAAAGSSAVAGPGPATAPAERTVKSAHGARSQPAGHAGLR